MTKCDTCGQEWPVTLLDGKPRFLRRRLLTDLIPIGLFRRLLMRAAARGVDFDWFEGPCCYGPCYNPAEALDYEAGWNRFRKPLWEKPGSIWAKADEDLEKGDVVAVIDGAARRADQIVKAEVEAYFGPGRFDAALERVQHAVDKIAVPATPEVRNIFGYPEPLVGKIIAEEGSVLYQYFQPVDGRPMVHGDIYPVDPLGRLLKAAGYDSAPTEYWYSP